MGKDKSEACKDSSKSNTQNGNELDDTRTVQIQTENVVIGDLFEGFLLM